MSVGTIVLGTLRVGFYGLGSIGLFINIFPSWIFKAGKRINNGELFDFASRVINRYGIKKEVTLIEGRSGFAGTGTLPGAAVLLVQRDATLTDEKTKADIEKNLASISLNEGLINFIIPIVIAIAARYLLIDQFPMGATLAELGFGTIAFLITVHGSEYAQRQMRNKNLLDHQG